MQIKRLEFGIATVNGLPDYKGKLFYARKELCGCKTVDFWIFYLTWLGDECYFACKDLECECQKDSPKKPS